MAGVSEAVGLEQHYGYDPYVGGFGPPLTPAHSHTYYYAPAYSYQPSRHPRAYSGTRKRYYGRGCRHCRNRREEQKMEDPFAVPQDYIDCIQEEKEVVLEDFSECSFATGTIGRSYEIEGFDLSPYTVEGDHEFVGAEY